VTGPHDGSPPPAADIGRLVGGRYLLGDIVGIGGMATVHRALDTRLDRAVAVKLLRREVMEDTDIAMRFRREALAATVLRHPNIVACLEAGTDDDQPYLVMELIEGEDLAARLRRTGRLEPAEAARLGLDVARGLAVAHVRGIVHRDVKPGNILLARDGRAMITDFGIARLAADAEGAVPGTTLGSVQYFSPEQARGWTTTAASDVYGLGLVLYEAVTGRRAWKGDTTAALAAVRIGAPAPSPRAVRPEVPATLDALIVRCLDSDPAGRFPNGAALAAALEPIVGRPEPSSPTVVMRQAAGSGGLAWAGAGALGPAAAVGTGTAAQVAGSGPAQALPAAAVGGTGQGATTGPAIAPPIRPSATGPDTSPARVATGSRPARPGTARRPSPAVAGPLLVLLSVLIVVGGALFVASRPPGSDAGALAAASGSVLPTARATAAPTATPTATATPKPSAKPTAKPNPKSAATPKPRPGAGTPDLCGPIFGIACGLDAGRYAPATFEPAIRFDLRNGWSTISQSPQQLVIGRREGTLTFASGIDTVYPNGEAARSPGSARALVETFITTDGVASTDPADRKVDKGRARVVDVWPSGRGRLPLFASGEQVYFIDASGPTRVVAVDSPDGPLIITIQASDGSSLDDLWPEAKRVIDGIRFR
jgi:serine/threonine-protein kinase